METTSKDKICPVCGYGLGFDFMSSFEICPSCGIQFGYHDAGGFVTNDNEEKLKEIYKKWRSDWIASGMVWDKGRSKPPANWNPVEQLKNIPEESK